MLMFSAAGNTPLERTSTAVTPTWAAEKGDTSPSTKEMAAGVPSPPPSLQCTSVSYGLPSQKVPRRFWLRSPEP